jgi:predicted PurR-regulated permease PerM
MQLKKSYIIAILIILSFAAFFWFLSNIMMYFIFSGILFLIGLPINNLLEKIEIKNKKIPRALSAVLTLLIMLFFFAGLVSLVIPQIIQQTKILSSIDTVLIADYFNDSIQKIEDFYRHYGNNKKETFVIFIQNKFTQIIDITNVSKIVNSVLQITGDFFIGVFSVSFITFFLLKDREDIYSLILSIVPNNYLNDFKAVVENCQYLLTRYMVGIIIQIFLIMTFITIGLSIFGIKNALLIGVFVGVFNLIPYLGPILGAIFGLFLGVTSGLQMGEIDVIFSILIKMLIVFGVVQLFDNIVFQPVIYSNSVKAHPLEIFLVILIAGNIFGIFGMVMAIPGYTIIRVIVKQILKSTDGTIETVDEIKKEEKSPLNI